MSLRENYDSIAARTKDYDSTFFDSVAVDEEVNEMEIAGTVQSARQQDYQQFKQGGQAIEMEGTTNELNMTSLTVGTAQTTNRDGGPNFALSTGFKPNE